jgi:alpha-beta hydrolase superfamily lysophospholipase
MTALGVRPRSIATWIGRLVGLAAAVYVAFVSVEGSRRLVRPGRRPLEALEGGPATPADLGLAYEEVSFETEDGIRLAGWLIAAGRETRAAVVLLHGFSWNRIPDLTEFVPWLQPEYHVLQFDFRGHGESGDAPITLGTAERRDVVAAVRFMESRGYGPIALMGLSMGASAAIMAAGDLPVAAVVADAPFAELHNPVENRMRELRYPLAGIGSRIVVLAAALRARIRLVQPIDRVAAISPRGLLLIAPREDRLTSWTQSQRLYDTAQEPKELFVVAGAEHGVARQQAGDEYVRRVLAFLERFMGRHGPHRSREASG